MYLCSSTRLTGKRCFEGFQSLCVFIELTFRWHASNYWQFFCFILFLCFAKCAWCCAFNLFSVSLPKIICSKGKILFPVFLPKIICSKGQILFPMPDTPKIIITAYCFSPCPVIFATCLLSYFLMFSWCEMQRWDWFSLTFHNPLQHSKKVQCETSLLSVFSGLRAINVFNFHKSNKDSNFSLIDCHIFFGFQFFLLWNFLQFFCHYFFLEKKKIKKDAISMLTWNLMASLRKSAWLNLLRLFRDH